jgi:hypothetical protein
MNRKKRLNNIKNIFFILYSSLLLQGCQEFSKNKLEENWLNSNSEYFHRFFNHLEKNEDFHFFIIKMNEFQLSTNFTYGALDYEDWENQSPQIKGIVKSNIISVNRIYLSSCLFNRKNISNSFSQEIQDEFFKWKELLKAAELIEIKDKMSLICRNHPANLVLD